MRSAQASFFYCNLFCKQTARLILIYLSKFLGTPCFSHRQDTKQGYEFLAKLYQAAMLSLFFISCRYALRTRFHGLPLDLIESCDSQLSRTAHSVLASSKCSRATVQVPRKSTVFHLQGSSCCTFLCFILDVPRKALERLPKGR